MHSSLFCRGHEVHRYLIEVGEELVLLHVYSAVVTDRDACLIVAEDLILLYLGEGGARTYDT